MRFNNCLIVLVSMFLGILFPAFIAAQPPDLYVSAAGANSVMRFDGTTGAFLGNFVAPGSGGLSDPQGIAFGPDGNLYVASNGSDSVLRFNGLTGAFIDVFASGQSMTWPAEINFRNGLLYVSDFSFGNGRVLRFNGMTGSFFDTFATGATFADGQSWDGNGDLLVSSNTAVRRHHGTTGAYLGDFVSPGSGGLSLALDNLFLPDGTFLVSSFNSGNIKHYAADGSFIGTPITIAAPQGLTIGPDGMLYAGSFGGGFINRYDINSLQLLGTFATTNGSSTTNNFVFGPNSVPEPGSGLLLLLAAGWVGLCRHRRNR